MTGIWMFSQEGDRSPSGCHHCGLDRRLHFQRWTDAAGWHKFTEPSRELVAERMRARYASRVATPTINPEEI